MKGIQIVSTGKALPEEIITNDDLSRIVDTNDEWITTRTGIKKRYRCTQENTTSLAVRAAYEAVEASGVDIAEIGAVIVATSTAENAFPSTAAIVQKELGLAENVLAFDLSSACTGFLHALNVGQALFNSTDYKYILLIGSEQMSKILDYTDRSTCVLFGDGAGAVVLKAVDNNTEDVTGALVGHERGIIDSNIYNDGTGASVLTGGRRFSDSCSTDIFIHMDGQEVFKFAVKSVPTAIETLLHNNNMDINEVDKFILHQANVRIIESVAKRLKADKDKFPVNLNEYGNTSSASIPILLDELNRNGSLKQGDKLILAGFGAGLSWGSILLVW